MLGVGAYGPFTGPGSFRGRKSGWGPLSSGTKDLSCVLQLAPQCSHGSDTLRRECDSAPSWFSPRELSKSKGEVAFSALTVFTQHGTKKAEGRHVSKGWTGCKYIFKRASPGKEIDIFRAPYIFTLFSKSIQRARHEVPAALSAVFPLPVNLLLSFWQCRAGSGR